MPPSSASPRSSRNTRRLGGTQSLIDALLSGQMNFGVTGVPGLNTLWDKTAGTPNEVRALSAVQSMPFMLVTNREAIKTIKDFNEHDKIALPAVKVSSQAICLQMAAAKEWGADQYAKLDAVHDHAPASGRRRLGDVEGDRGQQPLFGRALLLPGTGDAGRAPGAEILRHARRPGDQRRDDHVEEVPRRQSEGDRARSTPRSARRRTSSTRMPARRRRSTSRPPTKSAARRPS